MYSKILSIFLFLFIAIIPCSSYAVSGKGTEANPFRITTEDELMLLADFPECYFELDKDIELQNAWEPVAVFSGQFDGKGHTITVSSLVSKTNTGLFSTLSGTVKNLNITANNITCSATNFGLIAGVCTGIIENINIKVDNLSLSNSDNVGLVVGSCSGTIQNCKLSGSVKFNSTISTNVGGVCGILDGKIENAIVNLSPTFYCSTTSVNENIHMYAGGICGKLNGIVSKSCNISTISISASGRKESVYGYYSLGSVNYGGVSSSSSSSATIDSTYNFENLLNLSKDSFGRIYYGGITYTNSGTITNCYSVGGNSADVNDKRGISYGGSMTNCYYDKVILGDTSTEYGTPKSTIAMKMKATYEGWDFENVWAIDESEENPINDGYPYLREFHTDHNAPVTVSYIEILGSKLILDTKITEISDTYVLHIALYDSNDKLCNYIIIPNERQLKDVFVVLPDNEAYQYAKVFTWLGNEQIEPIATNEVVQIIR